MGVRELGGEASRVSVHACTHVRVRLTLGTVRIQLLTAPLQELLIRLRAEARSWQKADVQVTA